MKTSLIVILALFGYIGVPVLAHKPASFDSEALTTSSSSSASSSSPVQTTDLSKLETMITEPVVKKNIAWFIETYQLESIGILFFAVAVVYMIMGK